MHCAPCPSPWICTHVPTCLNGLGDHRHDGDEDGGDDVDDGPEEVDADRPGQVRLGPPQHGETQHAGAYTQLWTRTDRHTDIGWLVPDRTWDPETYCKHKELPSTVIVIG